MSSPWRVIIVGGGFGGLSAAVQALRSELVSRSQCLRVPPLRSSRLDRLAFDTPHVRGRWRAKCNPLINTLEYRERLNLQ